MESRTILIGVIGVLVLGAAGYATVNVMFMSDSQSSLNDKADNAGKTTCKSTLDSQATLMGEEDTREIPDSCFQNGEVVSGRLSGAEPGDKFRKTGDGIETVE
jgi:hypothetical protein